MLVGWQGLYRIEFIVHYVFVCVCHGMHKGVVGGCFQVSCPRHRLAPLVGGLPLRRCGVGVRGTAEDRASWLRPTLEAPRALSVVRERV